MKETIEEININKIDLMSLKRKGLSSLKISEMMGIPNQEIIDRIEHQEQFKHYSGVF